MSSWSHSQEAPSGTAGFIEPLSSPFAGGQENQGKGSKGSPTHGVNPIPMTRIAPMPMWKCRFGSLGEQGRRGRAGSDCPQDHLGASSAAPLPSRSRLYVPGINPLYSGFVSGGRQRVCSQTRSGAEAEGSHGRGNTCISRYLSRYKYILTKYMHRPSPPADTEGRL